MRIFGIVSLLTAYAFAEPVVKTLTKDNFDDFIKSSKVALVKFYAPWCGHCKSLAPEFVKAAETLGSEALLAEVDCDQADLKELCGKFDVRGYPTLKVFSEGVPIEYQGTREADGIVSYMKKFTAPVITILADTAAVDAFAASDRVVIIGFSDKSEGAEYDAFKKVANKFRTTFKFGWTSDAASITKHGSGFVLFKQFDEGQAKYTGELTSEEDLSKFVETQSVPLMDDIGPSNYQRYMESGLPLVYLFTQSAEEKKSLGAIVEPLAGKYKGKINFVHIDAMKFGGHAPYLNTEQKWPALVLHDKTETKDLKYPFPQDKTITAEAVAKFFDEYSAGTLPPKFKSEPVPEKNDGPIKQVVNSEYEKIVMDKTKDVLLEIYAPWCGHCKKLAPIYEELGKLFPASSNIVIAQFNGDANDLPVSAGFTIEGFPTIKLFKANDNAVVDYRGGHTLEALVAFLKENAVNKVDVEVPAAADKEDL